MVRVLTRLRPSPRPLRVLAARRRLQDRQARRARRELRPAGTRADRPRRHERRGRALQGLEEAQREADRGGRGLLRRRPPQPRSQGRAKPSDAARAERRGAAEPRQAVKHRLPRRAPSRQAGGRPRAARAARRGRHLPHGCLAAAASQRIVQGKLEEARRTSATWSRCSGPRTCTSRSSATGSPSRSRSTRRCNASPQELGQPLVATADVHYLRSDDFHHHAALLCVQTKSTLAQPKMSFDQNEFFLKSSEQMVEAFADMPQARRDDARDRRALQRRDRARQAADPALRLPGRQGREGLPARARRGRASASATATRRPPRRSSAWRWSSASSTTWASTPTS